MAHELRHGQAEQVPFDHRAIDAAVFRLVEQPACALEDVLVGKCGGGVDAVYHGVRFVAKQQLEQQAALEHGLRQIAVQVAEDQRAMRGVTQDDREIEPRHRRRREDVAPFDIDRHTAAVRLQRARRGAHFVFKQRHQHEAAWGRGRRRRQQAARHGVADEATAAEQHHRPVSELHGVGRSLRFPDG